MQRWKGSQEWEEVRPLGKGGQSTVTLVRNSVRIAERQKHLGTIKDLSALNLTSEPAEQFVSAIMGFGREDRVSELGALKVYNPRAAGDAAEQQALGRLQVEISVLAQNRRGLPKLLDSNEGEKWIVTEFLPGGTLENHIFNFKGNPLKSLTVFRQIVETVAALHKENIFHRDIKPANIFTDYGGNAVLGDFGIAFLPDLPERLTFTNESVGPRDYLPPWAEAEERLDTVSGHFDVYMLGKLLWCMVSGKLKLIREWYLRPEFDLTVTFQNDPRMHMINAILGKCLHDEREKCLPRADELLLVVDEHLNVMLRGGQMIREGVPRPCHVCGKGFYEGPANDQVLSLHSGSGTKPHLHSTWRHDGSIFAQALVCNYCGKIELFKP